MTKLVCIQLMISFLAGGIVITIQSVIAERSNRYISGILMMFPSTIVPGFLFLGMTTSPQIVSGFVPASLFPLGILVLTALIYINLAKALSRTCVSRNKQIMATFILTSCIWLVLVAPFALFRVHNILLGSLGYLVSVFLAAYFFGRVKHPESSGRLIYNRKQLIFRAAFIGSVIASIVLVSKLVNPFWGGVLAMYPAATVSSLVILHFYYRPEELGHFYMNAPVGSLTLYVYCMATMFFFPCIGALLGTVAAYLVSISFSLIVVRLQQFYLRLQGRLRIA